MTDDPKTPAESTESEDALLRAATEAAANARIRNRLREMGQS